MERPMTMNRVIHGAVRRDLSRLEAALAVAPDGDKDRAAALRDAYAYLQSELVRHHESEDALIFPMLGGFGVDRGLLEEMDQEHHAMAEALHSTRAAMEKYAASGSGVDAQAARERVVHTQEVVERHLGHEERDLDPVLVAHTDSPEWKAVEKKLRREPPRVAGPFFAWIQDGIQPEEQRYVASAVPGPVRWVMSRVFGRSYHREIAPVWRAQ
ncbi:MAG: hemerythrin domain-containing protein [Nocardioides sp.]